MLTRQSTIRRKYNGNTGYLLGNVDVGTQEFVGMGNCVDNRQTRWTDESQMMTSHWGCTSQSHKRIAQTNHTTQDDLMSKNGNDKGCFGMLQSNSGAYGVPETGLSNRNMSKSKGWTLQGSLSMLWMDKIQVNNQTKNH